MAETRCPSCGFSPIVEGAEVCPRCRRPFVPALPETTNVTRTRPGALTGSVTATPVPVAVALAAGALWWLCRGLGFPVATGGPAWLVAVAALDVGVVALVMANVGPAKHAPLGVGLVEIAAALWLSSSGSLLLWPSLAHGAVLMGMTAFEPSRKRLMAGAVAGGLATLAGIATMTWSVLPKPSHQAVIHHQGLGITLTLPPGWAPEQAAALAALVRVPLDGENTLYRGFGAKEPRRGGALVVSGEKVPELESSCRELLKTLEVTAPVKPISLAAPRVFGPDSRVYEVKTITGEIGRSACARLGTRFVLLVVISESGDARVGANAFEEVAAGLVFEP